MVGVEGKDYLQQTICLCFVYKAPQGSKCFNANLWLELEQDLWRLSGSFENAEYVIMGDMNCGVGPKQVNLPHVWDSFRTMHECLGR
jgi:hypothetical protein